MEKNNQEYYSELISSEKKLICFVQYEVFMKDPHQKHGVRSNLKKGRTEKEKRLFRRKINFVEVSSRIISAYNGYGVSEKLSHMFECSKKSFQCIYFLAMYLKTLILEKIGEIKFEKKNLTSNESQKKQCESNEEWEDLETDKNEEEKKESAQKYITYYPENDTLSELEPGKTICTHVMEKLVLSITEELYKTTNIPTPSDDYEGIDEIDNNVDENENLNPSFASDDDDIVTM